MINSILVKVSEEILGGTDSFARCRVGKVYAVTYCNLQTKHKWREFLGICMRRNNVQGEVRITLRNIIGDVGVEVSKGGKALGIISVVDTKIYKGDYRKARLYFLRRKPMTATRVRYK
jgi:ribosomal protein L19